MLAENQNSFDPAPDSNRNLRGKSTYRDYAKMPEGSAYQLIEGEIVMVPAPTPRHQRLVLRLAVVFDRFMKETNAGEVFIAPMDVYLDEHNCLQPDLLILKTENESRVGEKYIEGAPDLCVEILSKSGIKRDRVQKKALYAKHGVQEYWTLDPVADRLEIFWNTDGVFKSRLVAGRDEACSSLLFPELKIDLAEIF